MTTFAIATLGCKVNAYESESYAQILKEKGLEEVSFKEKADVYIINTCAVTNTAASKSRQKIHQAEKMNEKAIIAVVGCYAQTSSEKLQEDLRIDILIGSQEKHRLYELIQEALHHPKRQNVVKQSRMASVFESLPVERFTHQTRAYLKIQDGCNQFCSYCIIPYARGMERSLPMEEVIKSAKQLAQSKHLEIVLTGIHTGRYGFQDSITLAQLLAKLCEEVPQLQRIRISSIEVNEVSDELLDVMEKYPQIARHLHIPIQSANDHVLKAMHRPYNVEQFKKRVQEIRKRFPAISISSDVIVGFPQESEQEFEDTIHNIKDINFSFLHVFPYSKRDGTVAAAMDGHIEHAIKKARTAKLMEVSRMLYQEYKKQWCGKKVEVLFEKAVGEHMVGHTSEYLEVLVPVEQDKLQTMQVVQIEKMTGDTLYGHCLEETL